MTHTEPPTPERQPPRKMECIRQRSQALRHPSELVAFTDAALGSPVLSTLRTTLSNQYITGFPGLSSKLVRNHPG
jgi:hypothetical protein